MDLVNIANTLRDIHTSGLVYPPSSSVLQPPPTPIIVSFPLTMSTNHVSSSYSSEDELSSLLSPPPEANAMDTDNVFDTNIGANGGNGNGDGNCNINGNGNWVRFGQAKNGNDDSENEDKDKNKDKDKDEDKDKVDQLNDSRDTRQEHNSRDNRCECMQSQLGNESSDDNNTIPVPEGPIIVPRGIYERTVHPFWGKQANAEQKQRVKNRAKLVSFHLFLN